MPNGAYSPQCANCDFFKYHKNRHCCQKHFFLMPSLGAEIICADYLHHDEKPPGTNKLNTGELYFYSYASSDPPQSLGAFQTITKTITSCNIHNDEQYGWIIYAELQSLLPKENQHILVELNGQEYRFNTTSVERTHATGWTRVDEHHGRFSYTTQSHHILYCSENPNALRNWLDHYFEVERYFDYLNSHMFRDNLISSGIGTLVVIKQRRAYAL